MTLQAGQSLTIREAAACWQTWSAALAAGKGAVALDTTALEVVDTAGAQLVLALRRECQNQGRTLTLTPEQGVLSEGLQRLALNPL